LTQLREELADIPLMNGTALANAIREISVIRE
jgi:hypothetical protein